MFLATATLVIILLGGFASSFEDTSEAAILEKIKLFGETNDDCPSGWDNYFGTDRCVKVFGDKQTFFYALAACQEFYSGSLVSIHNAFQNTQIGLLAHNVDQTGSFLIGLYNFEEATGYQWSDGTSYDYFNWFDSNSANSSENSQTVVYLKPDEKNHWFPSVVYTEYPFICERGKQDFYDCHNGIIFNDYCYVSGTKHAKVEDAEEECMTMTNGHLVSIHSTEEQTFVNENFQLYWFWIGLRKDGSRWNWTDGTPFDFENWGKLDPVNNLPGYDISAAFIYVYFEKTWQSSKAELSDNVNIYPGVCKTPIKNIPVNSPTTVKKVESCHKNYEFNGHCYLFGDVLTSFESHDNLANEIDESSHLVSIHSQEEQSFVESFMKSWPSNYIQTVFWVGLQKKNGIWIWIDGSSLDYTNWAPNQPAYIDGSECAAMYNKTYTKWYTTDCYEMYIGMYKKKPWIDIFDE